MNINNTIMINDTPIGLGFSVYYEKNTMGKSISIPFDLFDETKNNKDDLNNLIDTIRNHINEVNDLFQFSYLSSILLAHGPNFDRYFDNEDINHLTMDYSLSLRILNNSFASDEEIDDAKFIISLFESAKVIKTENISIR